MTPQPRIVCIPGADSGLAAIAQEVAARLPADLAPADALAWYATQLRLAYPSATVRPQHELARTDNQEVWYVTRRLERFRIDLSVHVQLDPAEAFKAYVDQVMEWQTAVRLAPRRVTPNLIGTEYDATYELLGLRYQGTFRVLAAEPPRSITLEASGSGIAVSYTATFSPDAEGTLVRVQGDYSLPDHVLARAADRLGLERAINRDIERANESYRRLCASISR